MIGHLSKKISRLRRLSIEREIIRALTKTGYDRGDIDSAPDTFAERKPEPGQVYYYYNGPLDDKTRPFCRRLLVMDKVFSKEQIDYVSEELGYDVLVECGLYNCRHQWIRFIGRVILTPPPTVREVRKLINDGIHV